jgi:putative Holliday junction resolvase
MSNVKCQLSIVTFVVLLSLDFGLKRIGVAVGSTDSGVAFPREVILNDHRVFENIGDIIAKDHVEKILVGNPLKRDGAPGDIVAKLRQFVQQLKARWKLPIELVDERYTSKIADRKLAAAGISQKAGKQFQDSIAAQVVLQEYLEML